MVHSQIHPCTSKATRSSKPTDDRGTSQRASTEPSFYQPIIGRSEARVRSLLLEHVGDRGVIFDPETSEIVAVSRKLEGKVREIIDESGCDDLECQSVIENLGLSDACGNGRDDKVEPGALGLRVHLSHDCNMGCIYCYADGSGAGKGRSAKGAYGGAVSVMSLETLRRGIAKLHVACASERPLLISFFGGEPFLHEDRFIDCVNLVSEEARRYNRSIRMNVITNGTRISDRLIECLRDSRISLDVSLDGMKDVQDRLRPFRDGSGSYETVSSNILRFAESGISTNVRMTLRRDNCDFFRDHYSFSEMPVKAVGAYFDYYGEFGTEPMKLAEKRNIERHFYEIADMILRRSDVKARKLKIVQADLRSVIVGSRSRYSCGVGRSFWALTPEGDVYPCHRFVGLEQYSLGNVKDDHFCFRSSPMFEALAVDRRLLREDGRPNCGLCYAKHSCAGGCAHIGAMATGNIGEMPRFYCEYARLRLSTMVRYVAQRLLSQKGVDG